MPTPALWAGRLQWQQFAAPTRPLEILCLSHRLRANEPRGVKQVDADVVIDVVAKNTAKQN
jgi:hypothetical protein